MTWMLKNKSTGEIVDPRTDANFPLSPSDVIDGCESWDDVFAVDTEIDVIDGFERVLVSDQSIANLRDVWNVIDTPIFRVYTEGENADNAQVRRLDGGYWLYVDDIAGFLILEPSAVQAFDLVRE